MTYIAILTITLLSLTSVAHGDEFGCADVHELVTSGQSNVINLSPCTFTDAYFIYGLLEVGESFEFLVREANGNDSGVSFYPLVRRYLYAERHDFFYSEPEYLALIAAALSNIQSGLDPVSRERRSIYSTFILAEFRDQEIDGEFALTRFSREELTFAMSLQAVALEEIRTLEGIRCFVLADHVSVNYVEILSTEVYRHCMQ